MIFLFMALLKSVFVKKVIWFKKKFILHNFIVLKNLIVIDFFGGEYTTNENKIS